MSGQPEEAVLIVEGSVVDFLELDGDVDTGEEESPEDDEGEKAECFEGQFQDIYSLDCEGDLFLYGLKY